MSYYIVKLDRTVNIRVSLTFVLRKNEKYHDNFYDEYQCQKSKLSGEKAACNNITHGS